MVNKSGSPAPPPVAEHSAPLSMAVGTSLVPSLRKRRGRGRPSAENAEDVRKKLLDAAKDLFPRYGYRGVSSRQIGAAAGVNFAMIRYYFGGKPGLYREMLQGVLQPARSTLEEMGSADSLPKLANMCSEDTWLRGRKPDPVSILPAPGAGGGIGRRARLRALWTNSPWWFESTRAHWEKTRSGGSFLFPCSRLTSNGWPPT